MGCIDSVQACGPVAAVESLAKEVTEGEAPRSRSPSLVRAIRAEGEVPTIHAIAHSVARVLELDHLRMAEQLRRAGIPLKEAEE